MPYIQQLHTKIQKIKLKNKRIIMLMFERQETKELKTKNK